MRIKVLGSMEITEAGYEIVLAGQQQRALLAELILDLGNVVSVARLVDAIWDVNPPKSARTKIQGCVSAIRHQFGRAAPSAASLLVTSPPGYSLRHSGVWVDVAEFKAMFSRGQAALEAGDAPAASEILQAALALWRGQPFADVSSELIRTAAAGIGERRIQAVEAKAEADLMLGRDDTVAADLHEWLAAYPLRERLRGYCMLAAYRQGCRADALKLFREGWAVMASEFGMEPGPELCALHQRMLHDEPGLRVAPPRAAFASKGPRFTGEDWRWPGSEAQPPGGAQIRRGPTGQQRRAG